MSESVGVDYTPLKIGVIATVVFLVLFQASLVFALAIIAGFNVAILYAVIKK